MDDRRKMQQGRWLLLLSCVAMAFRLFCIHCSVMEEIVVRVYNNEAQYYDIFFSKQNLHTSCSRQEFLMLNVISVRSDHFTNTQRTCPCLVCTLSWMYTQYS